MLNHVVMLVLDRPYAEYYADSVKVELGVTKAVYRSTRSRNDCSGAGN